MSAGRTGAEVRASWRLATPTTRAGAIALLQVRGDVEGALAGLGIASVPVGAISVRTLAGIDRGLVARLRPDLALLMPHGGVEVLRRVSAALREAGIAEERDGDAGSAFPEAVSGLEARMLATLARAASPRAVDLLLDQPRRWRARGMADPPADTPAPDVEHSRLLGRLVDPPLIVAVGRSNIGKSTLLNRLAGRTVAAVADEPGTTRDHVGALVEIDGLVARYVDTPGVRVEAPAPEREAWTLVEALLPGADLVLSLGDTGSPPLGAPSGGPVVRVALRADLGPAAWPHDAEVSALAGAGIGELAVLLRRTLVPDCALASELPWRFWDCPGPRIAAGRSDPGV